jgi:hypothetical protein
MKLIIFAISIILFVSSCSENNKKPEETAELSFKMESIQASNDTLQSIIDISYPILTGNYSDKNVDKVNMFITKSVKKNIDVFKEGLLPEKELKELALQMNNEFLNEDSVFVLNNHFFSFYLMYYYYFAGAAHGNTYFETYNFNLNDSHLIDLDELFYENSDYLNLISHLCYEKLVDEVIAYSDENWIADGTLPNRNNFENFIITESGLLFIFEAYQVAAYAAGSQYVFLPYNALESVMNFNRLTELGIDYNQENSISNNYIDK